MEVVLVDASCWHILECDAQRHATKIFCGNEDTPSFRPHCFEKESGPTNPRFSILILLDQRSGLFLAFRFSSKSSWLT